MPADVGAPAGVVVALPVRFSDLDVFGHVNHARFLTFCEDHRTATMPADPADPQLPHLRVVVRRVEVDYLLPIGAAVREVLVGCTLARVGRTSFELDYEIVTGGGVAARIHTVLVRTDAAGRPQPLGDAERTALTRYTP